MRPTRFRSLVATRRLYDSFNDVPRPELLFGPKIAQGNRIEPPPFSVAVDTADAHRLTVRHAWRRVRSDRNQYAFGCHVDPQAKGQSQVSRMQLRYPRHIGVSRCVWPATHREVKGRAAGSPVFESEHDHPLRCWSWHRSGFRRPASSSLRSSDAASESVQARITQTSPRWSRSWLRPACRRTWRGERDATGRPCDPAPAA
jgi:hypothetical protein